jgi:hypothetical protein
VTANTDPDNECATECNGAGACEAANGTACTLASQCQSAFCVDGYCCNSACSTTCVACSNAKSGGANGTCTNIPNNSDPDNECAAACNGSGACQTSTSPCDPATEVEYQGYCYYLDGSKGLCDSGYTLGPQSVLYTIGPSFAGKNYKHVVSQNCCIYNSEPDEDFGMQDHCNTNGPFTATDVAAGAAGCTNQTNFFTGQLTLCMK